MEQRKQTAVQYLEMMIKNMFEHGADFGHDYDAILMHIHMAKKRERNQIEKSYCDGFDDGYLLANGENTKFDDCYLYYHETYGK